MAYTVLGFFEGREDAQQAIGKLVSGGFDENKLDLSPYRTEGTYVADDYDFEEEDKTSGFWDWLFGDDDSEKQKHSRIGARSIVVTVYADSKDDAERASSILDDYGAIDIDRQNEEMGRDSNAFDDAAVQDEFGDDSSKEAYVAVDMDSDASNDVDHNTDTIDVIKEDINVEKHQEDGGGVTVRSRIIERPVEEKVRLRDERVYVTRKPVNRVVEGSDAFQDKTLEMNEMSEKAVVNKTTRVVEEISLDKEVSEHEETISDTVRETEIDVDKEKQD